MAKTEQIQTTDNIPLKVETIDIRSQIHIVRGKQVMLDSDLAMLYKVETGALNRAVKCNKKRFPEDFCFQLSEEEFLRCQNGISKDDDPDGRGGRRYMPYAFTEQGISKIMPNRSRRACTDEKLRKDLLSIGLTKRLIRYIFKTEVLMENRSK